MLKVGGELVVIRSVSSRLYSNLAWKGTIPILQFLAHMDSIGSQLRLQYNVPTQQPQAAVSWGTTSSIALGWTSTADHCQREDIGLDGS